MGRTRRPRSPLGIYLATSVPIAALTFALPRYHIVLWGLLGLTSAAAVVVGAAANRAGRRLPWMLVALALATFVAGDVVYDILTEVLHREAPYPSVADGFYLATYPLLAAGLVLMARARRRERDVGALLDALIVTTACALLSWMYLIQPYVRAGDMTLSEKAISAAYPLGDVVILCVLARVLSAGGRRNRSLSLLTLGAGGLLAADVAYGAIQLNGTWQVGGPVDVGWVLFYVCWGAAALHPSMRALTEAQPAREQHLSRLTLLVLCATTLVAPGLLVWRAATDGNGVGGDAGTIGLASGLLFGLVMARMTGVARAQAAQASRERVLRATGERLVAASDLEAVGVAALEAAAAIIGDGAATCLMTEQDGVHHRVLASVPRGLEGSLIAVLSPSGPGRSVLVHQIDGDALPATADARWTCLALPGPHRGRRRLLVGHEGGLPAGAANVLDALAAQLTLAADRVAMAEDLHRRVIEARFRALIQNASDVILVAEPNGRLRPETPSIEAVLGYPPAVLGSVRLEDLLHPDDRGAAAALIHNMRSGTASGAVTAEWRIRHREGRWLDMEIIANDLSGDADVAGIVLTLRDVSERKSLERELRHQAFHDSLTGLANRVLFNDRVDHALARRGRSGTHVSVLLVDVDDFKLVNDTLGHAAGDDLLVQIADRIVGCLREGDTAARLGGDEFAVCVESDDGAASLSALAQRMLDATQASYRLAGNDITVHVSIGISASGHLTGTAAEMLREADMALYSAKAAGKASYRFFEPSLHVAAVARVERRAALDEAIRTGGLRVHYQPIVSLADGEMVGVEALVRWQHPVLGLVPPSEFVPLAEESGLIVPLGQYVLNRACADMGRWQRDHESGSPFVVAVNVSARQLQSPDFLEVVDAAISANGLRPDALSLEITESVLVQDSLDVINRLNALHLLGFQLALDDFGTGYSSLSYLHRFPIQILKIDRSFVSGIDTDADRTSILRAIVALAQSLNLKLVAEGIEEEAEVRHLVALGCQFGQGYYYGRPVPAQAIDEAIRRRPPGGDRTGRPSGDPMGRLRRAG